MQTLYLSVLALFGGFLFLFAAAGWSSYKEKKLPATPTLFRWFVTGLLSAGLASYAWIFGAGGDPASLLGSVGEALEVKDVMNTLTSAVGNAGEAVEKTAAAAAEGIKVGMPAF
jgi:drug/metabolite transporter (DMT)-like permease